MRVMIMGKIGRPVMWAKVAVPGARLAMPPRRGSSMPGVLWRASGMIARNSPLRSFLIMLFRIPDSPRTSDSMPAELRRRSKYAFTRGLRWWATMLMMGMPLEPNDLPARSQVPMCGPAIMPPLPVSI